jgi:hypothetical protein
MMLFYLLVPAAIGYLGTVLAVASLIHQPLPLLTRRQGKFSLVINRYRERELMHMMGLFHSNNTNIGAPFI